MSRKKKVYSYEEITNHLISDLDWKDERDKEVEKKIDEKKRISPKTKNQEIYYNFIETSTVTMVYGKSGTGKTLLACYKAVEMLTSGRIEKIIVTRPLVTCGEDFGFLPGNLDEKIKEYMVPVLEYFSDFLNRNEIIKMIENQQIQIIPLALMRGRTFENSFIIADEMENATYSQLKCLLTRLGKNSRMVLVGDVEQTDLKNYNKEIPYFDVINKLYHKHPDINICYMTEDDILRHGLIKIFLKYL